MPVALIYSDSYLVRLGGLENAHPFDVNKYAKIVAALIDAGFGAREDFFVPEPVTYEDLSLVHEWRYLRTLEDARVVAHALEAPQLAVLPNEMVKNGVLGAFAAATGGSVMGARLAIEHGVAINIGGGFHHAMPDHGEGFNVYNDIAVAIRAAQRDGVIETALVVDLDVHQGNGTAVVFDGDPTVFTFSAHQQDLYPQPKATSSLDLGLRAGLDDRGYRDAISVAIPRIFDEHPADLVVFQAGCDVLAGDPLAGMCLSVQELVHRDLAVINACVARGLPVLMLLGGGYGKDAWRAQFESIAAIVGTHGRTPRTAGRFERARKRAAKLLRKK